MSLSEKGKKLYRIKNKDIVKKLYIELRNEEVYDCSLESDFTKVEEINLDNYEIETLKIRKVGYELASHIKLMSTRFSVVGIPINGLETVIETALLYCLLECSIFDIELEKDEYGFDRISEKCWESIAKGTEEELALEPQILVGIYRAIKEVNKVL